MPGRADRRRYRHRPVCHRTFGDDAFVPVYVYLHAGHGLTANQGGKGIRGHLTAAVGFAFGVFAELLGFWGIDARQPKPLTMNFYRVPIDYRSHSDIVEVRSGVAVVILGLPMVMASIRVKFAGMR